jgi:hypothetical protein
MNGPWQFSIKQALAATALVALVALLAHYAPHDFAWFGCQSY